MYLSVGKLRPFRISGGRTRRGTFVLTALAGLVFLPAASCAASPPPAKTWRVAPGQVVVKFFSGADRRKIDDLIARCESAVKVESQAQLDSTPLEELTGNLFWLELTGGQSVETALACFRAEPELVESAEPNVWSDPDARDTRSDESDSVENGPSGPAGAKPPAN